MVRLIVSMMRQMYRYEVVTTPILQIMIDLMHMQSIMTLIHTVSVSQQLGIMLMHSP